MQTNRQRRPSVINESTKSIADTTAKEGQCEETGLHMECGGTELHIRRVLPNTGWVIANGVKAWKTLAHEGSKNDHFYQPKSAQHKDSPSQDHLGQDSRTAEPSAPQCPLATADIRQTPPPGHPTVISQDDVASHNDGLTKRSAQDPIAAEAQSQGASSNPPSATGSAQKCPIRFLDRHTPEEVAVYFKNHQSEMPRSHEICVKRYQRNEEQIRELDNKYGDLVHMIQGLGQKHKPLLCTREEEEEPMTQDQASNKKVEQWADDVSKEADSTKGDAAQGTDRDGHFDRPLKEIRVGESPSRPWGISVPQAQIAASAVSAQEPIFSQPLDLPTPSSPVPERIESTARSRELPSDKKQPQMLFTGPVFIGYPPEQVAYLQQNKDLDKTRRRNL